MSKQDVIEVEGIVNISCYFRQAQDELHPHLAGRQGYRGDVSIRPDQRQNYLEIQVVLYN